MFQVEIEWRRGAVGRAGESGEGVWSSGSESGAFRAEAVREIRAENGIDETSEISGGCARSRCTREGGAMGCDVAKARCEVSARECRRRCLDPGGGLLLVPVIK